MKKSLYALLISFVYCIHIHALLIKGDPNAANNETFSFDVGFAKFSQKTDTSAPRLWIASSDPAMNSYPNTAKPYGLSYISEFVSYVKPGIVSSATAMTNSEPATIYTFKNNVVKSSYEANPIWGAQFQFFDVNFEKPVFVLANNLSKLYATLDIEHRENPTGEKPNITKLLLYNFGAGNNIVNMAAVGQNIVLAHSITPFGTDNTSKISLLTRATLKSQSYLNLLADTSITTATTALTANSINLSALGTNVALTSLPYIGVDATAAAGGYAAGIAIATITPIIPVPTQAPISTLTFSQIAPSSVLKQAFDTVVSATLGNRIRITNAAHMTTSTNLTYVIVARDAGTGPQTIYALPVISGKDSKANAHMIADFTYITTKFSFNPHTYSHRYFTTPISDPAQINPAGTFNPQLAVGAGALPLDLNNSIKSLFTLGDSVYAVIGDSYTATQSPGTFQSQAIFAVDGHIVAWTPWTRVLGSDKQMLTASISSNTLSSFYVAHATTNCRAVYQTTFTPSSNLAPLIKAGQSTPGGIQGIFNFPQQTDGFNNGISLLVTTGYNNVTIGKTGTFNTGIFTVNPMSSSSVLSFSQANINNHKSLIAAEIAHDGTGNHWLFVGGATGVSVLTEDATGYTWNGTLANLSDLTAAGQNWKRVGNFSMVKKLVWDSTYLYILTPTQLYQVLLDPNFFTSAPTTLTPTLITTSNNVSSDSYFTDIIIDNGFCLLGTTNGLYSLNLPSSSATKIDIPDGLPSVSKLIAYSANLEPQRHFATQSNLLVLNNSFALQQAHLNRFVIQNSVVTPFNDFITGYTDSNNQVVGNLTSFIKFNDYINNYFSDGTWNLASTYFLGINQPDQRHYTPLIQQLFSGITSGQSSTHVIMPLVSAYAPFSFLQHTNNLVGFVRESTSGALVIAGDFASLANA